MFSNLLAILSTVSAAPAPAPATSNSPFALTAIHSTSPVHLLSIGIRSQVDGHLSVNSTVTSNYTISDGHLYANGAGVVVQDGGYLVSGYTTNLNSGFAIEDRVLTYQGSNSFAVCHGEESEEIVTSPDGTVPETCTDPINIVMLVYEFDQQE